MTKDLLFEIGTEDLPPNDLPGIAEGFQESLLSQFEDNYISFEDADLYYTSRRLGIRVVNVSETQDTRTKSIRGPAKQVGLDEEGNYTQAAVGFANSHSADVEDLYVGEDQDGTYFYLDKYIEGRETKGVLQEILPEVIVDLPQPEKMRWDSSGLKFLRPIRWVVCLLGREVVEVEMGDLKTGRETSGHRFLGARSLEIDSPDRYLEILTDNFVMARPESRKEEVLTQLNREAQKVNGEKASSDTFLQMISNSLEYPTAILGELPEKFLDLPNILLFKTLEGEARLIPLRDKDEDHSPLPYFVGFRDGKEDAEGIVRAGYESVINARLRDSQFFFNKDREQELHEYVNDLKTVTYQESLGSIWDKVERMRSIARIIVEEVNIADTEEIDRTIYLCKADLVTSVIDEFPDLQGQIGSIYARMDGESTPVVEGIREHYLPESSDDPVPESPTGLVASLADKIDSLLGSFLLGEEPTGTSDPYGLRRKANAVVRVAIERELDFDLYNLLDQAGGLYEFLGTDNSPSRLKGYFTDRLQRVLKDNYGFSYDVVEAVVALDPSNFYEVYRKASALQEWKRDPELEELATSFSRIVNITPEDHDSDFEPDLFELEIEKELWREYLKKEGQVEKLIGNNEYTEAIETLLELKEPVDEYFERVMVMAENSQVRKNRLGFLRSLHDLYAQVADFSKIVIEE